MHLFHLTIPQFNSELVAAARAISRLGHPVLFICHENIASLVASKHNIEPSQLVTYKQHSFRPLFLSRLPFFLGKPASLVSNILSLKRLSNDLLFILRRFKVVSVYDSSFWGVNANLVLISLCSSLHIRTVHIPAWSRVGGRDGMAAFRRLYQNPESAYVFSGILAVLFRLICPSHILSRSRREIVFSHSPLLLFSAFLSGVNVRDSWEMPSPLFDICCASSLKSTAYLESSRYYANSTVFFTGRFSNAEVLPSTPDLLGEFDSLRARGSKVIVWSPSPYSDHNVLSREQYSRYLYIVSNWLLSCDCASLFVSPHPALDLELLRAPVFMRKFSILENYSLSTVLASRPDLFVSSKYSSTAELCLQAGIPFLSYDLLSLFFRQDLVAADRRMSRLFVDEDVACASSFWEFQLLYRQLTQHSSASAPFLPFSCQLSGFLAIV